MTTGHLPIELTSQRPAGEFLTGGPFPMWRLELGGLSTSTGDVPSLIGEEEVRALTQQTRTLLVAMIGTIVAVGSVAITLTQLA